MKKRQTFKGLIIVLVVIAAVIGLVRHFHIKNFHTIAPGVLYTSGQPRGMDYTRLLYKYHIATIVNLRSASEHREQHWYNEEITWVRKNGVGYEEIPTQRGEHLPSKKTVKRFLEIIDDKSRLPVLVHCSSGEYRAPLLAAVWLVKRNGLSTKEVIKKIEKINGKALSKETKAFLADLGNN